MGNIYNHHLFFYTHQRNDGAPHCQQHGASDFRQYAKEQVKALNLEKVRVNNAGCLNRCKHGPMLVIYPEGTWYQYKSRGDIDNIISSHLQNGHIVKRLAR